MPPASKEYRDIERGNYHDSNHVRFSRGDNRMDDRSNRSHGSSGSKSLKKIITSPFRWGSSKKVRHSGEQQGLYQEVQSAGTFDSDNGTETSSYAHPKSKESMTKKWGTLEEQMKAQAPDMWMRTQEAARQMAEGGFATSFGRENIEEQIKQAQDKIRNMMEFSLWHCLLAILVYVGVSVYCFSYWLEDWSIVDSIYFAVVTFTTIGYGDMVPDTRLSRIFTCFWALSGVACLGIALGVLGSNLIEVKEKEEKKARDKHSSEVIGMLTDDDVPLQARVPRKGGYGKYDDSTTTSQLSELEIQGVEEYFQRNHEDDEESTDGSSCWPPCSCSPKLRRFSLLFTFLVATLYGISRTENWNVYVTVYYGLITASTVGYGDLSPTSELGRILAILYIPIAVGVMGTFLDVVANSIIDSKRDKAQEYLKSKELTLRDLAVMDSDGDGQVTRAEFLEFMLVAMNQVDQDMLDSLKEHFIRLDKDKSGTLDKADLLTLAQKNLDSQNLDSQRMMI